MNKLYLSCFLLLMGAPVLAQETTEPVLNKSNRIILHFTDTTGLFTQLGRLLVDREYDMDMINRELGILRTKSSPLRGGNNFGDQMEFRAVFRDSTITFSGVTYDDSYYNFVRSENKYEVSYSKRWVRNIMIAWVEMMKIAELLKPAFITYATVDVSVPYQPSPPPHQYRRNN